MWYAASFGFGPHSPSVISLSFHLQLVAVSPLKGSVRLVQRVTLPTRLNSLSRLRAL
jgi:hypothetical protein